MPETRTVRDAADVPPTGHNTSILVFDGDNPILDALIGCQGRVVYTEENLLAAGHAYEDAHRAALDTNDYEAGLIAGARAAITAAGGVVADEVVEIANEDGHIQHTAHKDDAEYSYIDVAPGDKLYITREETADDQG